MKTAWEEKSRGMFREERSAQAAGDAAAVETYHVGKMVLEVEYSEEGPTLEDCLRDLLSFSGGR